MLSDVTDGVHGAPTSRVEKGQLYGFGDDRACGTATVKSALHLGGGARTIVTNDGVAEKTLMKFEYSCPHMSLTVTIFSTAAGVSRVIYMFARYVSRRADECLQGPRTQPSLGCFTWAPRRARALLRS